MLLQANISTICCFSHIYRCSQWCLRTQQYLFHWSQSRLHHFYSGSKVMVRCHYTRTRTIPHASCLCYNALSTRDTNHYIFQYSHCSIHSVNYLNIQKKVNAKLPKEEIALDKDELVTNNDNIYDDKLLRGTGLTFDPKLCTIESSSGDFPPVTTKSNNEKLEKEESPSSTEQTPISLGDPAAHAIRKENVSIMDNQELPSRVQRYFLWRYSWYLKKFQESLKQEMPDTFKMFHIFTVGVKEFVIDFKDFIKVLLLLSLPGSSLRSLTHHQLLLYYNMPGDMLRVFPVLLLSSVPFGQNVAFPIGYWFPRHLLCRHFWDIQQRHEFAVLEFKKRLFNARPVFRSLQASLASIVDEEEQAKCRTVFFKLGSGIHPNTEEILSLIPLFRGDPFHIRSIRSSHVNGLLRLHGRSVWGLRRRRLVEHARILHCMDAALTADNLTTLSHDTLRMCLFLRGLNPTHMSTAAMMEYLEDWLSVSRKIDKSCYSLLLHLPILLTYNQPSNIILIY